MIHGKLFNSRLVLMRILQYEFFPKTFCSQNNKEYRHICLLTITLDSYKQALLAKKYHQSQASIAA
jgi:hypothetical protein